MKYFTGTILGIALVFASLSACASVPPAGTTAASTGSSVWKISKDGNTLFLGGSVHILRSTDFPLPKEFDLAYAAAETLVLEADLEKLADQEFALYLVTNMMLPQGKTLPSILEPEVFSRLNEKCAEFGILLESIVQFKPAMILTTLSMMQIQQAGFIQQGVDAYYFAAAKKDGKALDFLETAEAQAKILAAMGDGYENDFVKYSLDDMDNTGSGAMLAALVAEWKQGKAGVTEAGLAEMKEQWPVIYQDLLLERNAAWMPQLISYLNTGPVEFVIAGLAHLHGTDGLLRQLEEAGCTVEQLRL